MSQTQTILGPFGRIEGDLEIRLEPRENQVGAAFVTAPMFRGFETMLEGRAPLDALVIAPRVCGICSVAQSLAARSALAGLTDLRLPRNAERVFNLMQAIENTSDLLSHFYLYLAPELQRQGYKDRKWFAQAKRFALGTEPYKKAVA